MKETPIKERPILFQPEMVRAILSGDKTQTRRIVKRQPIAREWIQRDGDGWTYAMLKDSENACIPVKCPYGSVGDRLWVRETWRMWGWATDVATVVYKASERESFTEKSEIFPVEGKKYIKPDMNWKPSIHMPRWASRLTLEITDINVERLQDISEEDAIAEGYESLSDLRQRSQWFNKHWASNPWVWKISFRKVEGI